MRHFTQATTEDIFYSRKTLECNPKHETSTSFNITIFEASYHKQDENSRFKKSTFVHIFRSASLNFLPNWRAKKIGKEQTATGIENKRVFNKNCRLP